MRAMTARPSSWAALARSPKRSRPLRLGGLVVEGKFGGIVGDDAAGVDDDAVDFGAFPVFAPQGDVVANNVVFSDVGLAPANGAAVPGGVVGVGACGAGGGGSLSEEFGRGEKDGGGGDLSEEIAAGRFPGGLPIPIVNERIVSSPDGGAKGR